MTTPDCDTRVHGTPSAYRQGCRCEAARHAYAVYRKRCRHGLQPAGYAPMWKATRRLRALAAMGYPQPWLANKIHVNLRQVGRILTGDGATVYAFTFAATDATYREWAMIPGPSAMTRTIARRKGWVSALAWNDIDDPAEQPSVNGPAWKGADEAVVIQLIAGRTVKARREDKREAARRMLTAGVTANVVASRVGWSWTSALNLKNEMERETHAAA